VNFQIRNDDTSSIEFWTDNQQRMTIDKTGWVGIGTPFSALTRGTNVTTGAAGPGTTSTGVLFAVNGAAEFNGEVYSASDFWLSSDEKLKTNFSSLNSDWKKILTLSPYSYDFKKVDGLNLSKRRSFGFKAQEVKEVFPSLVSEGDSFLAVNYIGFIPFLTQGVQEHEERLNIIENLRRNILESEKKILELESEIEVLQNQNTQFAQIFRELEKENKDLKTKLEALEEFVYKQQGNSEGIGQTGTLKKPATIEQNEPNPFFQETLIRYFLPEGSVNAKIEVKNTEGKVVGSYPLSQVGHGNITLASGTLAAGNYYYSLIINNNIVDAKKMILLN
jgi:Skp family chaperone for outer membrane proteins